MPRRPVRIIWDMGKTLERLGGDEKLFHEVMGIFLEEVPKHMASLKQAIVQRECEGRRGDSSHA